MKALQTTTDLSDIDSRQRKNMKQEENSERNRNCGQQAIPVCKFACRQRAIINLHRRFRRARARLVEEVTAAVTSSAVWWINGQRWNVYDVV
jgi:hypothetical protein